MDGGFIPKYLLKKMMRIREEFLWVCLVFGCLSCRVWSQLPQPQPQGLQVPCFFIFGDSLVDNGNNNRILTLSRANYRPYGIDFPQGTTGRFTNGRTYVDALGIYTTNKIDFLLKFYLLFLYD